VRGTYVAREIVAGTLAVELAEAIADVTAGLVVGHELLGSETSGAGIAHVDTRHHAGSSSRKDLQKAMQSDSASVFELSPAPSGICSIFVHTNHSPKHACMLRRGRMWHCQPNSSNLLLRLQFLPLPPTATKLACPVVVACMAYAWICAHVLLLLQCANIAVPLPTVQQRVCHMCTPPPKPLSALAAVQWL